MGQIKWYKRDPKDALQGMMQLTLEQRGAYNTILDLIYASDNNLHDDVRFMCAWLGCDVRVWKRLRADLIAAGKITIEDGFIRNFRATSVVDEALLRTELTTEVARSYGHKSGVVRRDNNNLENQTANRIQNTDLREESPLPPKGGDGSSGEHHGREARAVRSRARVGIAESVEHIIGELEVSERQGGGRMRHHHPRTLPGLRKGAA